MANTTGLGDTIYAAVRKALEDKNGSSGGSGGGGSSDFTTAHVTVMAGTVSETFETDAFNVCTFLEAEGPAASVTAPIMGDDPVESLEFDAILYKGTAALSTYLPVASTSGGITDCGDGHFFVTGDCTITVS